MMRRATHHHSLGGPLIIAATVLPGAIVYDRMAAIDADGLVQALATSDSHDVPRVVDASTTSRRRVTPRIFGYAPDLLPSYCCYIGNSGCQSWSVARGIPNEAGLFDMLGNVSEWCCNIFADHPDSRRERVASASGFWTISRSVGTTSVRVLAWSARRTAFPRFNRSSCLRAAFASPIRFGPSKRQSLFLT
jgi:hypothetical protein